MGVSDWLEVWMAIWLAIQLPIGMLLGRYFRHAAALGLNSKPVDSESVERPKGWQGFLQGYVPAR
jgi:hypothetical protein